MGRSISPSSLCGQKFLGVLDVHVTMARFINSLLFRHILIVKNIVFYLKEGKVMVIYRKGSLKPLGRLFNFWLWKGGGGGCLFEIIKFHKNF